MALQIKLLDGTSIPWLAWGTATEFSKGLSVFDAGTIAVGAGVRHIDTAQLYGTEKESGQVLTKSGLNRSDIYITSKLTSVGTTDDTPAMIDDTVRKLGTIPDLFLVHNPYVGDIKAIWRVLEQYKDEGKLKSIGVSNFRPQDLEAILDGAKHKPVVNQLEYHPFTLTHLEPLLALQANHNIITESYGPLTPLLRHPAQGGPLKPVLERIAARINESKTVDATIDAATVLLLWTRARGVVAVTSSSTKHNSEKLGKTYQLPQLLDESEVNEITEIGKKFHFRHYREHMEDDFPVPDLPNAQ